MQNQTTGVRHTEGLLHFGYTSLPVIGTVFDCQLSHVEPETPCADGSHVLRQVCHFGGSKPQTQACPFCGTDRQKREGQDELYIEKWAKKDRT